MHQTMIFFGDILRRSILKSVWGSTLGARSDLPEWFGIVSLLGFRVPMNARVMAAHHHDAIVPIGYYSTTM